MKTTFSEDPGNDKNIWESVFFDFALLLLPPFLNFLNKFTMITTTIIFQSKQCLAECHGSTQYFQGRILAHDY